MSNFPRSRRLAFVSVFVVCAGLVGSCKNAGYALQESVFGKHKRDLLIDRVESAREDQQEAKEQFQTTFERFQALTKFDGGELEKRYKQLQGEYDDCVDEAEDVRERIAAIEEVSKDLFREWKDEIDEIQSPELRERSSDQLDTAKERYAGLIKAMRKASKDMDPVLAAFKDQVLFLKHSLNARAIASLEGELGAIETDVARLIETMQKSIQEADAFIVTMKT